MKTTYYMSDIQQLVEKLQSATFFQDAGKIFLESLLELTESGVLEEHKDLSLNAARASLHLRGDNEYTNLVTVESKAGERPADLLLPSSTVWRLIESHKQPIALNVIFGETRVVSTDTAVSNDGATAVSVDPSQSIAGLDARQTTHLLALPLMGMSGNLKGMVSLEFCCEQIASEINWARVVSALETQLLVASPYVLTLPSSPMPHSSVDVLPVPSTWSRDKAALLKVLASQRQTILIKGPTGSGKTYLAKWIHDHSAQKDGPMVEARLNQMTDDAGLPHLFGWTKGAYTGAVSANRGWVRGAEGGTLFLDEIDTLSMRQQYGLLQLLDAGTFSVMGSGESRQITSVRFIAATNRDLAALVSAGSFREDLYHRLNTLAIVLPALAERRDEIPAWAQYFANNYTLSESGNRRAQFTEPAIRLLTNAALPGNLRELRATVLRSCTFAEINNGNAELLVVGETDVAEGLDVSRPTEAGDPVSVLRRAAELLIESALRDREGVLQPSVLQSKGLFHDMVWMVAVQKLGDSLLGNREARARVAALLNKENAVRGNNYGTELRRACERLSQFYGEHGTELPKEIRRILKLDESDSSLLPPSEIS